MDVERNFEIKHQNQILMNRIGFQMSKKTKFPRKQLGFYYTLFQLYSFLITAIKERPYDPKRMRDLKQIEKENEVDLCF